MMILRKITLDTINMESLYSSLKRKYNIRYKFFRFQHFNDKFCSYMIFCSILCTATKKATKKHRMSYLTVDLLAKIREHLSRVITCDITKVILQCNKTFIAFLFISKQFCF